jgi:nitrogen fixation-related uncharacterized protein
MAPMGPLMISISVVVVILAIIIAVFGWRALSKKQ